VLILDEPVNGLDPEGVLWIRNLMKSLAAEGRTVFVSSHLMNEMAVTAEQLIVIGRGRLIAQGPIADIVEAGAQVQVLVRAPRADDLTAELTREGATVEREDDNTLRVRGTDAARVGELAHRAGIVLHELTPQRASLEEAFMELTKDTVEYQAGPPTGIPTYRPAADGAAERQGVAQ
jgi:ABC-2 type transport system ATP-binding protein